MSTRSQYVKEWRKRTKERLLSIFDNKCCICGYDRCSNALEFHHIDPSTKSFAIGSVNKIMNWNVLIEEVKKCICVCSNCHREIHVGLVTIPTNFSVDFSKADLYDPQFVKKRDISRMNFDVLKSGEMTIKEFAKLHNCSTAFIWKTLNELGICLHRKQKMDISKEELEELIKIKPFTQIAAMFNVTDNTVRKKCMSFGITIPKRRGEWTRRLIHEKVMHLYENNKSTLEISQILKISIKEIENIIKTKTRKHRLPQPNLNENEVINMFCSGMSERLIADNFKCRRSNIQNIIKKWIKHYPI